MKFKLALAAVVLALAPGLAGAACYGDHEKMSTSACAEGQTWDAEAQTCVDTSA